METPKLQNIKYFPLYLIGIGSVVSAFVLLYILLAPINFIKIDNPRSIAIEDLNVTTRDALIYRIKYCKYNDQGATVYRQLYQVNAPHNLITFPAVSSVVQKGCNTSRIPLQMNSGTPPGRYVLRGDIQFKVSAFRIIHYYYQSQEFNITDPANTTSTVITNTTVNSGTVSQTPVSDAYTATPIQVPGPAPKGSNTASQPVPQSNAGPIAHALSQIPVIGGLFK